MFEHAIYGVSLIFVLIMLGLVDQRWRLAYFYQRRRTVRVLLGGLGVFVLWDIAGIAQHIFFIGSAPILSGVRLGANFPLEEILFLCVLVYTTLLLWRGLERL